MRKSTIAMTLLAGSVAVAAHAGQGATKSRECADGVTRVDGVGERLRLTGECSSVVVSGSGNRVTIERTASINVSGMNNTVEWEESLEGDKPKVISSGIGNSVTRAKATAAARAPKGDRAAPATPDASGTTRKPTTPTAPRPQAAPGERLRISQSGQTLEMACENRAVSISGNTNTVVLTGTCGQVGISGTGNKVSVERTPRIVVTGHGNEVTWQQGAGDAKPAVRDSGARNVVRQSAS
jgi:hypothetical protein